jgi:hypothetical protein
MQAVLGQTLIITVEKLIKGFSVDQVQGGEDREAGEGGEGAFEDAAEASLVAGIIGIGMHHIGRDEGAVHIIESGLPEGEGFWGGLMHGQRLLGERKGKKTYIRKTF